MEGGLWFRNYFLAFIKASVVIRGHVLVMLASPSGPSKCMVTHRGGVQKFPSSCAPTCMHVHHKLRECTPRGAVTLTDEGRSTYRRGHFTQKNYIKVYINKTVTQVALWVM